MTPNEIRGGLQVDPFNTTVFKAQDEWVIQWHTTSDDSPEQVGQAAFRETDDGIEWTRYFIREPFRGQGIYTQTLRWLLGLDVEVTIPGRSVEAKWWKGFKPAKEGGLKLDKRVAKARVKVR